MMTSNREIKDAYVWIWLPGEIKPVVAGKLTQQKSRSVFNYGQRYLERASAISIDPQVLPLQPGLQMHTTHEGIHGCLRDSAPDAWGRRIILNTVLGKKGKDADPANLSEITYLMESGSDRIGALDFQASPSEYISRATDKAPLETLMQSAELLEQGCPLNDALAQALYHGTSIGGARPKALLDAGHKKLIAKFSSSADTYPVIKAEFMAMRLAAHCGLNVANVELLKILGKEVLLIERFDRVYTTNGWTRKLILSALTLLGLDEMGARYASYQDLAEIIRHRFTDPKNTLNELFSRIMFNILCSNNDDHARNHAAFWDGRTFALTPAYDICPQLRYGEETSQAMLLVDQNRSSQLLTAMKAARHFLLTDQCARAIIDHQIQTIHEKWDEVSKQALLSNLEYALFKERLFLRPYAFQGYA